MISFFRHLTSYLQVGVFLSVLSENNEKRTPNIQILHIWSYHERVQNNFLNLKWIFHFPCLQGNTEFTSSCCNFRYLYILPLYWYLLKKEKLNFKCRTRDPWNYPSLNQVTLIVSDHSMDNLSLSGLIFSNSYFVNFYLKFFNSYSLTKWDKKVLSYFSV